MRYNFECGVLLNYSPRGTSQEAIRSRTIKGRIKNADPSTLQRVCEVINDDARAVIIREFIDEHACLVPVPRSAPLLPGALWPTKVICDTLVNFGIGNQTAEIVSRHQAVPKSASIYNADDRPSVETHINSLIVGPPPPDVQTFILVDDVLTLGRTTAACAYKIQDTIPGVTVKIFSVIRTMGKTDDIAQIIQPRCDYLYYNTATGKSWLPIL